VLTTNPTQHTGSLATDKNDKYDKYDKYEVSSLPMERPSTPHYKKYKKFKIDLELIATQEKILFNIIQVLINISIWFRPFFKCKFWCGIF
jgi:hypothetical protein